MRGDDLDHIDVGDELVEQPLQRDQRATDRGDAAGDFDAVARRELGERGKERRDIQFGQIDRAELLDDHVEIGEQRRVILAIRTGDGEPQQAVRQSRRILFGDGEEKKIDLRPGSSLPMIVIPSVPEKDGAAGEWDGLDTAELENILFDMSFEAVYSSRRGTIQSEQTNEKGRPLVLAEGAFAADAQVSAEAAEEQLRLEDGQTLLDGWILHIPEGTETLRFLYEGEAEVKLLTCGEDGAWSEAAFVRDGSYLVFPATSGVVKLALAEEQNSLLPWVVAGCGLAVIAGILIALRIRKKKKA